MNGVMSKSKETLVSHIWSLFYPEETGSKILQNIDTYVPNYVVPYPTTMYSNSS